jgi:proteasome lid subunit RPN8/RPN11
LIRIARRLLRAVEDHARQAWPEEACGLLIGECRGAETLIVAAEKTANIAVDRTRRFEIDPARHIALQRGLRGTERAVVGVYHSHPDGSAEPSTTDAALALDPDLVWLIVSLRNGELGGSKAFSLMAGGGTFANVPIEIEDET